MLRPALLVLSAALLMGLVSEAGAHHCDSCGVVCINFCNTREFRSCCINYIRKRSQPPGPPPAPQLAAPPAAGVEPWPERLNRRLSRLLPVAGGGFLLAPAAAPATLEEEEAADV